MVQSSKIGGGSALANTPRWERRRAEILSAAEEVFASRGFSGARLEDIAELLGMQRPALIYYFKDKIELYDQTIASIVEAILGRVERLGPVKHEADIEQVFSDLWLEFAIDRPAAARVLLRQMLETGLPPSESGKVHIHAVFEKLRGKISAVSRRKGLKKADIEQLIIVSSTLSLLWVTIGDNVKRRLEYDTLAPDQLKKFRHLVNSMVHAGLNAD